LAFLVHDSFASNVLFQFEGGRYGRWEGVGELGRCHNTNSGWIECTLDAFLYTDIVDLGPFLFVVRATFTYAYHVTKPSRRGSEIMLLEDIHSGLNCLSFICD